MKQSEKLDLILRELYKYRFDGKYYNIGYLLEILNIEFEEHSELRMLGKRLENDGLIRTIWMKSGASACLTSHGIEYCEETSYSNSGSSLVTNNYQITIQNSPNSNIVTQSTNTYIQSNFNQITEKITQILNAIKEESSINEDEKRELIDNLEEIEILLKADKKPKASYKTLLENSASIAGIGSLVVELGKLILGV